MAQFARPSSDGTKVGVWTDEGGGTTNLFSKFDEVTPSDTDWASSPLTPVDADSYQTGLSSVTDPAVNTGHVARYRIGKMGSGGVFNAEGRNIDVEIRLRQGDSGTVIAEWPHTNLGLATTHAQTLSGAQADAITNYATLFLEFDPIGATSGPNTRKFAVTWAELEVPDAAAGQNIPVGQATEAETANPITAVTPRNVPVGQASESETANAIAPAAARMVAVGQATESETARAITPVIGRMVPIGQVAETETAGTVTPSSGVAVGHATEVELARLISPVKPIAVPVQTAVERELAQVITASKVVPGQLGPAICEVVSPSVECETFAL